MNIPMKKLCLEIIAYKLQVMEIRRTFNRDKNSEICLI